MKKTATITVRHDEQVKRDSQNFLKLLGMTTIQAITMYLNQINLEKALPYHPNIPNPETERALNDLENKHDVKVFETAETALAHLGI